VEIHQAAYNTLAELNEAVPESKKVADFLAGITDAKSLTAKDLILGDPAKLGDFEAYQQYLKTLVYNKATQDTHERNVSGVQGGNGRVKNKGKRNRQGSNADKSDLTARSYTRDEWLKLSKEQREKIRALHAAKKNKSTGQQPERNASSVNQEGNGNATHGAVSNGSAQETNNNGRLRVMDLSHFYDPDSNDRNKCELDWHADTCIAGANTVPLWYTDVKVSVSPFIGEYSPLENVPIASVATAWDCPTDGGTILLVINEALYFGDRMDHSLLCPNQLRGFGLIVNDVPKSYDPNSTHSIILPGQLKLPLQMRGVISYLETRKPTEEELKSCLQYEITSAASWDPYKAGGNSLGDHHGYDREAHSLSAKLARSDQMCPMELAEDFLPCLITAIKITTSADISSVTQEGHEADVILHYDNLQREHGALRAPSKSSVITKEDLARRWFTGLESAEATLKVTTKEGMRFVDGDLERRLWTSQAHL
jgi:hypothetical protein